MNTRSHGTSTLSKIASPSPSSSRDDSGKSIGEAAFWCTTDGRQTKRKPGVATGIAKPKA